MNFLEIVGATFLVIIFLSGLYIAWMLRRIGE